jgi:hypothetical protein
MKPTISLVKIILSLLFIMPISLFAEKDPIKFGKVDKADLEMKVYPLDTSAVAVILCDFGRFNSFRLQFERTLWIKILKKEGTSLGNQVFPFPTDAIIKGITYNLENGEIVESKLKSESIFKENVIKNNYRKRVAMPNVKEGSIIDLQFVYTGPPPPEWRFQEQIPVRWSELNIEPSPYVTFRKNLFGFVPLVVNKDSHWIAKDMPAFKKEPYMNSWENYITKLEIEISKIDIPGLIQEYITTWGSVNEKLIDNSRFGKAMYGCAFLNDIAKEIEQKYTSPMDRLIAAHEQIKKAVKWNERESVFSSNENLSYAFNKKIGNSGDINLMMIELLKKLDFDVYPVVLSTRSNGFLSPVSPSLDKLNYVVAYVTLNGKNYFIDATEEFIPVGMLPARCINLQGRSINKDKSDWVDLFSGQKDKQFISFDLKLNDENTLQGKLLTTRSEYAAFDFRKKYEKFNSREEYLKNLESERKGLNVLDCNISNLDSIYLPLKESYDVKIKNAVTTAGDRIYINPMLYEQITSNPFKSEDRKYPVDFIYPRELTYVLRLEIPKNAEVVEIPKELSLKLQDGSAFLQYQALSADKYVTLAYKFIIRKTIYNEGEYADLRTLFSEIVKKHSEQIILKKI